MTATTPKDKLTHPGQGDVYKAVEQRTGQEFWWAMWRDHANRLVRKKIGPTGSIHSSKMAKHRAFELFVKYRDQLMDELAAKNAADDERIEYLANIAPFPREVVAYMIDCICNAIANESIGAEAHLARPGFQSFVDRMDTLSDAQKRRMPKITSAKERKSVSAVSGREVIRIFEEVERITVGTHIVDKICVEFNYNYSDFVQSALHWAAKTDEWKDRTGSLDPWPIGYVVEPKEVQEII
jgi:hypothetical protein